MIYNFPRIETIDDVLPHIEGKEEFVVSKKEGYTIINYTHRTPDTFPPLGGPNDTKNAILRECRGIAFYPDGRIMSRPFHKFFNMNELPEVSEEKVRHEMNFFPSVMLEKLDGSMVRPMFIDQTQPELFKFGTKMGLTDTSAEVDKWYNRNIDPGSNSINMHDFLMNMFDVGYTPIFEWCSRKNKIVLDYPDDRLVLVAARENITGEYLSLAFLEKAAITWKMDLVQNLTHKNLTFKQIAEMEGVEGCVTRFNGGAALGHSVKTKSTWYLALHKTKDAVRQEKDVLALILDDQVDDLYPLLDDADKTKVQTFSRVVWSSIKKAGEQYDRYTNDARKNQVSAKIFALDYAPYLPEKSIAFNIFRKNQDTKAAIVDYCRKNCHSKKAVDNVRRLLGDHVRYDGVDDE